MLKHALSLLFALQATTAHAREEVYLVCTSTDQVDNVSIEVLKVNADRTEILRRTRARPRTDHVELLIYNVTQYSPIVHAENLVGRDKRRLRIDPVTGDAYFGYLIDDRDKPFMWNTETNTQGLPNDKDIWAENRYRCVKGQSLL